MAGKKSKNPLDRLQMCSDYASGRFTGEEIAKKYGISRRTLMNYMQSYNQTYAELYDFLIDIVKWLQENGEWKASDLLYARRFGLLKKAAGNAPEGFDFSAADKARGFQAPQEPSSTSATFEEIFGAPPIDEIDV